MSTCARDSRLNCWSSRCFTADKGYFDTPARLMSDQQVGTCTELHQALT